MGGLGTRWGCTTEPLPSSKVKRRLLQECCLGDDTSLKKQEEEKRHGPIERLGLVVVSVVPPVSLHAGP